MAQFALADELGVYLGRDLEPSEVTQADLLLQLASAAIQSEARQSLEFVADDTVALRGEWGGSIWLPERPVVDVTAVTVRHGYGLPLVVALTGIQYAWDRRGLLYRGPGLMGVESNAGVPWGGWGSTTSMVEVTYSHGYESIPDDIKGLCLASAARAFLRSVVPVGATSETIDGYAVTYAASEARNVTLDPDEMRIARRYRPWNA